MSARRLSWILPSVLVVLIVLVLVGVYAFLPSVLGNVIARSIQGQMQLQDTPGVTLEGESPLGMLAGQFEEGQVSLQDAQFGGIKPRRVTLDLDPFDLDVAKSMRSGELASEQPLSGTLRMEISEKEISRIAAESAEDVSVENVDLRKDQVTVETGAQVLGFEVPVEVAGGLEIREENLVFVPRRVAAFGVDLPDRAADEVLSQADFSYPIRDLPYDARVEDVRVREGYLVVSGRLESIPLEGAGG